MLSSEIIVNGASIVAGLFLILLGWGIIGGSFVSEDFQARAAKRKWLWRVGGIFLLIFGIAGMLLRR